MKPNLGKRMDEDLLKTEEKYHEKLKNRINGI